MAATGYDVSKNKYWRTTHKFDIEVPKTVGGTLYIDSKMGTYFWDKSIGKEMKFFIIAFEKLDDMMTELM